VCGSNLLKEGEDIKLKPDDEYPDWLWTLRTGEM
jgi:large subunit ribosomal protein L54